MSQRNPQQVGRQSRRPPQKPIGTQRSQSRRSTAKPVKHPKLRKGILFGAVGVVLIAAVSGSGGDKSSTPDVASTSAVVTQAPEETTRETYPMNRTEGTTAIISQEEAAIPSAAPTVKATAEPTVAPTAEPWSLRVGDKGDDVRSLQNRLIALGYLSGGADGIYGESTENAVRTFQRVAGLQQTGICDESTAIAMKSETAPGAPTPTPEPTVYITPNGKKYHLRSCPRIDLNTAKSGPVSKAKEMGYTACGVCNPPY